MSIESGSFGFPKYCSESTFSWVIMVIAVPLRKQAFWKDTKLAKPWSSLWRPAPPGNLLTTLTTPSVVMLRWNTKKWVRKGNRRKNYRRSRDDWRKEKWDIGGENNQWLRDNRKRENWFLLKARIPCWEDHTLSIWLTRLSELLCFTIWTVKTKMTNKCVSHFCFCL